MILWYSLDADNNPVPHPDVESMLSATKSEGWDRKVVAKTTTSPGVEVSTVFLHLDHNFYADGPPILFETMVFGGPMDGEQWRYATWAEAERGHKAVVYEVLATTDKEEVRLDTG